MFDKNILRGVTGVVLGLRIGSIVLAAFVLKRAVKRVIKRAVGGSKRKDTLSEVLEDLLGVVIWSVAALMILSEAGVNIGPILAGAGVAGVALGFGAQYIIRDFLAGFFIVLENQFRVGDIIRVDQVCGVVEDISLRRTVLRDKEGAVHYISNGEIKQVANMSQDFARANLEIGVGYDESLDEVRKTIDEIGDRMYREEKWQSRLRERPHFFRVEELGKSAVVVSVRAETGAGQQWDVSSELKKRIKEVFEKQGIEMPYPRIEISI